MSSWDAVIALVIGHFTVPLVSLANRKSWPDQLRFAVALGIAAAAGAVTLLAHGDTFTSAHFLATFGVAFATQQATWNFKIPFTAGDPALNEALENVKLLPAPKATKRKGGRR